MDAIEVEIVELVEEESVEPKEVVEKISDELSVSNGEVINVLVDMMRRGYFRYTRGESLSPVNEYPSE